MSEVAQTTETTGSEQQTQQSIDPKVIQAMYGDLERHKSELSQTKAEAKAAQEKLTRLTEALAGPRETPQENMDALHDEILEAALEAEKNGQPIPLTLKLSEELRRTKAELRSAMEALKETKTKTERLSDPSVVHENQVYQHMDNLTQREIESIYGKENKQVFKAVTASLVSEIDDLRKNEPDTWERIKLDPDLQRRMVHHFIMQQVPNNARKMMQEKALAAQPFTVKDTLEAMKEAKQLKDPKLRAEALAITRQKFWEQRLERRGRMDNAY